MKLLFDYFPIILFFTSFKLYGIYVATAVVIAASLLQISISWFKYHHVPLVHVLTGVILIIFGGSTLLLKDPIFIKWKPTIVSWLLAVICLGSCFITKKTFMQYLLDKKVELPKTAWQHLNYGWILFFFTIGTINLYVAYAYNTNTWVNFKLFGIVGATIIFSLIQSLYMAKYLKNIHEEK